MPLSRVRPRPRRLLAAGAAVAAAVTAVVGLAPAAAADPADPVVPAGCSDLELVVAGGVGEPGVLGQYLGDPLLAEMKDAFDGYRVTGHRVAVPSLLGFSDTITGAKNVVAHLDARSRDCPDQVYVLVGWSAGAPAVDHALGAEGTTGGPASLLPEAALGTVGAVLLFGDPNQSHRMIVPPIWAERTRRWCHDGDPYCNPGLLNGNLFGVLDLLDAGTHLTYGRDAPEAARFVREALLGG